MAVSIFRKGKTAVAGGVSAWHGWVAGILLAGAVYLLALQLITPDGAFLTGDSGLKALLSQSLAAGPLDFRLHFPNPPWVRGLWVEGMFPYLQPYVYRLGKTYAITFPFTFPLLSAPFYRLFGYRGLYLAPILSTLGTWLAFAWACRKLRFSTAATLIGLAALIFATPFSLYSAMVWEHAPSVFLAFAGLVLLIPSQGQSRLRPAAAAWAGVLAGLAVSLRPEQVFLVISVDALCLLALAQQRAQQRWPFLKRLNLASLPGARLPGALESAAWVFPLASTLTLLAYGASNQLIYGNFFGVHAIQVLEHQTLHSRLWTAVDNLQLMTLGANALALFMPFALFSLLYLALAWVRKLRLPYAPDWTLLYGLCLVMMLGAAALVPGGAGGKQWGPRFYLLLAPLLALLLAWQLNSLRQASRVARLAAWGLALALLVVGIYQNPLRGTAFLIDNYAQIAPAVQELRRAAQPVVAISDPFIGQPLHPALPPQTIVLLANEENHLARLSEALAQNQIPSFAYVCFPEDCPLRDLGVTEREVERGGRVYRLRVQQSGQYGKYLIYQVRVEEE